MKEILKLTRHRHLEHLTKVMPFMFIIYTGQCYLFINLFKNMSVGNYCLSLGVCLVSMIIMMYKYNTEHIIKVYDTHILVEFKLFWINKVIKINDIDEIYVSNPDMSFSNICLKMQNGKKHNFYFIDDAKKITNLILKQKTVFSDLEQAA